MLAAYYDNKGKLQKEKKELQADIFAAKVNEKLLTQAVNAYLANQRQSNAQTKDRGEVSGGGKKPWRQKGTGSRKLQTLSPLLHERLSATHYQGRNLRFQSSLGALDRYRYEYGIEKMANSARNHRFPENDGI